MARQSYDVVTLLYPIDGDMLLKKCRYKHLLKSQHSIAYRSYDCCVTLCLCPLSALWLKRERGEERRGKRFEEFEYFFEGILGDPCYTPC